MKQNWKKWMAAVCFVTASLTCKVMAQGLPEGLSSDFDYPAGLHCENGPNLNPTFVTSQGAYPFVEVTGNVVFVNNLTGEIDMSASNPGTWTIKRVAPSDSTFRQVTITTQDIAHIYYDPDTVCMSMTQVVFPLNLGTGSGTYSGFPVTVTLDSSNGAVQVNASLAGTYMITYFTAGVCPDTTVTPLTLIAPIPSFVSYPQSLYCQMGNTTPDTLFPTGPGLLTSSPSGLVMNPFTGDIALGQSQPGTYLVTYHGPGACADSFTTVLQIVAPDSGDLFEYVPGDYCQSDTIAFPIVFGTPNLIFTGQPGFQINATTGEIDPSQLSPGNYTIVANAMTVCGETSSQVITVSGPATVSLTQVGNMLIAPGPGVNHQWYLNGQLIPGATDSSIVMSASGTYSVHYDRPGEPCGTIGEGVFTGREELQGGIRYIKVYPQPSSGIVHCEVALAMPLAVDWSVTDLLGRTLRQGRWNVAEFHSGTLDLSGLGAGHYLFRLESKGGMATTQLVVGR